MPLCKLQLNTLLPKYHVIFITWEGNGCAFCNNLTNWTRVWFYYKSSNSTNILQHIKLSHHKCTLFTKHSVHRVRPFLFYLVKRKTSNIRQQPLWKFSSLLLVQNFNCISQSIENWLVIILILNLLQILRPNKTN